jgi:hypothetical protein
MELLNQVFATALILNDGHEIFARLSAGDDVITIVDDLNNKFGRPRMGRAIRAVGDNWPPHHLEAVSTLVQWALSKLDTDDRITIDWKGDAESEETITKFELREHRLHIEFSHPPFRRAAVVGAA